MQYVKDNIDKLWLEQPVYQHGDFHPGNLILTPQKTLGVIDFNRWEVEVLRGESIKTFHFESTNQFFTDKYQMPEGITMIGGKTGNTNKAGYCLALYVKDQSGDCYIAEIFGAKSREELFPSMIQLLTHISEE